MTVPVEIERIVRGRGKGGCEYCRMHQWLQGATFHIEQITPASRGGDTATLNLALACPRCNLHKSDREFADDPISGFRVRLFHPRIDLWEDHFCWQGTIAVGITEIGRATAAVLDFNHPRRQLIRNAERRFGFFPPTNDETGTDVTL